MINRRPMSKSINLVSIRLPAVYRIEDRERNGNHIYRSSPIQFWTECINRKNAHIGYITKESWRGKLVWVSLTDKSYDDEVLPPTFWSYDLSDCFQDILPGY